MATVLATFEAYYSRPIAPTRRIALGRMDLPVDPSPGFGGILLGAIVARYARELDEEIREELDDLIDALEAERHVGQPQLRHRLQRDKVGLTRCRHHLATVGEEVEFVFDSHVGTPAQNVLCAVYAAAAVPGPERIGAFMAVRKGLDWIGAIDHRLFRYLSDDKAGVASVGSDPVRWAMRILGISRPLVEAGRGSALFGEDDLAPSGRILPADELRAGDEIGFLAPERLGADRNDDRWNDEVSRAFRTQLLLAHPDHGGSVELAADRISSLREARRILLGR